MFPKVLGAAFLVSEKNFLKKKVSGEIAFALISLFHVQIKSLRAGQIS